MLQILLAFVYSSMLCLAWGGILLRRTLQQFHPAMVALTGLAMVGIQLQALSIFIPLGGWGIHCCIAAIPVIYYLFLPQQAALIWGMVRRSTRNMHWAGWLFLSVSSLYTLLVGTWEIIHPDTIAYHAPIMEWSKLYKAVPGLVNINERIGLQSSWFQLAAFFSFDFTGTKSLTFINTTILGWFFYYIAARISEAVTNKNAHTLLLIMLLLVQCFGTSTMLYLTAASLNQDFIICIFTWAAFDLYLNTREGVGAATRLFLAGLFLIFSATVKLSAIPSWLLLPLLLLTGKADRPARHAAVMIATAVVALVPFMVRNIITSGYPLFPSTLFDYFNVDWKYPLTSMHTLDEYITAHARIGYLAEGRQYGHGDFMPLREWVPIWWESFGFSGKCLFAMSGISLVILLVYSRRMATQHRRLFWIAATCVAGTALWLWKAPAPRFMQAFLVPLPVIACHLLLTHLRPRFITFRLALITSVVVAAGVASYDIYRILRFSNIAMTWQPRGIRPTLAEPFKCDGMTIYRSKDIYGCGSSYLPCTFFDCSMIEPRGVKPDDGFRKRPIKNPR